MKKQGRTPALSKKAASDRARVIADARKALAVRHAIAAVPGYNTRTARLDAARKRAETAPTPEQQARVPYVEADVNDYVGGVRIRIGRAFRRQPRFETIEGLPVAHLLALRRYRRAFDVSEVSPMKSALDVGEGRGGGGTEAAIARIEAVAFADIDVRRIETTVSPNLLSVLRAIALEDQDFKAVAQQVYGSSSGKRRQQVKGAFLLAAKQMAAAPSRRNTAATQAPVEVVQEEIPPPSITPALLDERGYLRPWSEIADILREAAE